MSHSYYRNPRGRMIKMGIMFGSLCISAYTLPKTFEKIGGSGIESLIQPGGGISPDAQRLLGEGGLDSLLGTENESVKKSNDGLPVVITPAGSTTGEAYQRLRRQAQQMAPIKVVGKKQDKGAGSGSGDDGAQVAQETETAVDRMLELLEEQKKGGG